MSHAIMNLYLEFYNYDILLVYVIVLKKFIWQTTKRAKVE